MKNLNKLSLEEQASLIFYTTHKGTIIYYSGIQAISNTSINYNGSELPVPVEDNIEDIKEGKLHYELYKLSMAKSDADLILTNKVNSIVKEHFDTELTAMTNHFEQGYSSLRDTLESKLQDLSIAEHSTQELHKRLTIFSNAFDKFEKELDVESLNGSIRETLRVFKPAADELTNAVALLKTLFKS